jgi:fibrillarin-like rRNA methylase
VRRADPFEPHPASPRLFRRADPRGRSTLWTVPLGEPPALFGERVGYSGNRAFRLFDPASSKLAAALVRGWRGPIPEPNEKWLYLGAAAGTTATYVADLVGRDGSVYAVEKSPRPFGRLIERARRYPNLFPILADARRPAEYLALVPPVDGLYADVSQPDQVSIALENGRRFLRAGGAFLLALKAASLGRERTPEEHARASREAIGRSVDPEPTLPLEPFHKRHYFLGGAATRAMVREAGAAGGRRRPMPARRGGSGS